MHFFGPLGVICFLIGFGSSVYLVVEKLRHYTSFGLTSKPAFYIAMTTMVIGSQLFLTGFVAELISRNSPGRNTYLIEEKLGIDHS